MLLVFDFDGTLVDSLRDLAEAASDLAREYGGRALDEGAVSRMIGEGASVLVERVLATAGFEAPPAGALERFLAIYDRRMLDHTAPYPGMADALAALAPKHDLALLTNKPEEPSRRIMAHTRLDRFFPDGVFGDGPFPRKPAPDGLRWLMARHAASPADTLMVGDSMTDLDTGHAAGVRVCLARYGFGFQGVAAGSLGADDLIIDCASELPVAVAGLAPIC